MVQKVARLRIAWNVRSRVANQCSVAKAVVQVGTEPVDTGFVKILLLESELVIVVEGAKF